MSWDKYLALMRILIISPYDSEFGLAKFYHKAFQKLGHEAIFSPIFGAAPWMSRWSRVVMSLCSRKSQFRDLIVAPRLNAILHLSSKVRYDLVFVIQGDALPPRFLLRLRETTSAQLFLYYSDNPWTSAQAESHFWSDLPLWDCVFTFHRCLIPGLYQRGARRVEYLPFGYDPDTHSPRRPPPETTQLYACQIAYLGTWGPVVEGWLRPLIPYGLKIWGNSWEKAAKDVAACWQHPGSCGRGLGAEMAFVCQGADIVVNFIRSEHLSGHSMKTFELPACGGFMLSTRTDEQLEYFAEDQCAAYFWTEEELLDKVKFYLSHPETRERIRQTGLERSRPHTYCRRATKVFGVWEEMVKGSKFNISYGATQRPRY